ncbi:hypothetical protein [Streptomyces hirsutus]|uniref:hypothetical protein n=1 Tax=Streptomyces hirsutus TaxID=35620 RepID=UPI003D9F5758
MLTTSFLTGVDRNPAIPAEGKSRATAELRSGAPFLSDAQLESGLGEAGTSTKVTRAALDANPDARIDGPRAALALLALLAFTALLAMFFTSRIPKTRPRSTEPQPRDGWNQAVPDRTGPSHPGPDRTREKITELGRKADSELWGPPWDETPRVRGGEVPARAGVHHRHHAEAEAVCGTARP